VRLFDSLTKFPIKHTFASIAGRYEEDAAEFPARDLYPRSGDSCWLVWMRYAQRLEELGSTIWN
jgi:hypothetical protein